MNIERDFSKTEEKVRYVMKQYEQARNDDDFLIWFIKRHIEEANLNRFAEYRDTTNSETIRRVRAEIQNDHNDLLPTDPEVIEQRQIKEEKVREYFVKNKKSRLKYEKYRKYKKKN